MFARFASARRSARICRAQRVAIARSHAAQAAERRLVAAIGIDETRVAAMRAADRRATTLGR